MLKESLRKIASILGCREKDMSQKGVSHFAFDSKDVRRGSLFFALQGKKADGHTFLREVAGRGAVGAVVSKAYRGKSYGLSLFYVEDVKTSLQKLAAESYKRFPALVIGVTGTVGKTTTKEMIATLLSKKYRVYKSPSNANSQVSFPLNLLNRDKRSEILVLEMGMSFSGELTKLVSITPPQIGVVTPISLGHAENFMNLEEIAKAKAELFSSSHTQLAVVHHETVSFEPIRQISCPKILYRLDGEEEEYTGKCVRKGLVVCQKGEEEVQIALSFLERHFLENFLAAIAVARYLGLSWSDIQEGALTISFQPHRFQKITRGDILFIDDTYNASPLAVREALKNLPFPKRGKRSVAVFGAMKELGCFSEQCHREIGTFALGFVDILLCYGKECFPMAETFLEGGKLAKWFSSREEMTKYLISFLKPGDVVLLKGANSLRMWEILTDLYK